MRLEEIPRPRDARRQLADADVVAAPEAPDAIAETIVPLRERPRKLAELIAARADVPGFRDEFQFAQYRVLQQRREKRRLSVKTFGSARERCRQIETKSVHAAKFGPGAQGVEREARGRRAVHRENIAAARVIYVMARRIWAQSIISRVIEAAQRQTWGQTRRLLPCG